MEDTGKVRSDLQRAAKTIQRVHVQQRLWGCLYLRARSALVPGEKSMIALGAALLVLREGAANIITVSTTLHPFSINFKADCYIKPSNRPGHGAATERGGDLLRFIAPARLSNK